MATTRRAFLLLGGGLLLAGGGGFAGWRVTRDRGRAELLATGQRLLAEGHLREARGVAERLMADAPDWLDGYLLAAWTLRALHDRPATADVLGQAYDVQPRGFPMLAEYIDHRMRGPDDPKKGYDSLAFLEQHLAHFPEDANIVAQGRLVALAYLLGQETLHGEQRQTATEMAEKALAEFRIDGAGTTGQHYDRAQVLLALGRFDESVAAARAGIAAGTDKWQSLVMHWAIITAMLHHGKDEAAWGELDAIWASIAEWPGTHFGMGKPLVEFIQLTQSVRFGKRTPAPADYEERLARLSQEGVRLQYGDDETRELVRRLIRAMENRDTPGGIQLVDDLLKIAARDRGCEMENQIIRPNTECMLLVAKGDLLMAVHEFTRAEAAYRVALALFPGDLWLSSKVSNAQMAVMPGEEIDPLELRARNRDL